MSSKTKQMKKSLSPVVPSVKETFEPGAILESSWGYEQTNIDFFCVLEIKNGWAIVQAMDQKSVYNNEFMTSKETPTMLSNSKPFRRKIKTSYNGKDSYVKITSYSYADLWDGREANASHYA